MMSAHILEKKTARQDRRAATQNEKTEI